MFSRALVDSIGLESCTRLFSGVDGLYFLGIVLRALVCYRGATMHYYFSLFLGTMSFTLGAGVVPRFSASVLEFFAVCFPGLPTV